MDGFSLSNWTQYLWVYGSELRTNWITRNEYISQSHSILPVNGVGGSVEQFSAQMAAYQQFAHLVHIPNEPLQTPNDRFIRVIHNFVDRVSIHFAAVTPSVCALTTLLNCH
eukprot:Blabericola_migrator_1__2105@NODE_1580_length_4237_cov_221_241487_g1032_i0_p7_GENE_NODE_1580_length_4237_cov_221_241487_g1032_i0NODE_1580_length_4237_cov_221_241487_g1032_i0_p7_ORF_typecomplete_len111_score9_41_NODE_1580_length_4237_cov_221_241487_g1032_i017202052